MQVVQKTNGQGLSISSPPSSVTYDVPSQVLIDPATGNPYSAAPLAAPQNTEPPALHTLAAAVAGTFNSPDQSNLNGRGVTVIVDITAVGGTTPNLTVTIEGKDPVSGKYFTLLASAALGAIGTTVLTVYPGLAAAANLVANAVLPKIWRVRAVVGGGVGAAITATVGAVVQL